MPSGLSLLLSSPRTLLNQHSSVVVRRISTAMTNSGKPTIKAAEDFLTFVNASPTRTVSCYGSKCERADHT